MEITHKLGALREQIDDVDKNLIELIALRLKLVKEAAEVKKIWVRELSIPNESAFCLNQDMTLQQSMICLTDLLKIS